MHGRQPVSTSRWFVETLVQLASELIARDRWLALSLIRDPRGPFVHANVHAFVINLRWPAPVDIPRGSACAPVRTTSRVGSNRSERQNAPCHCQRSQRLSSRYPTLKRRVRQIA